MWGMLFGAIGAGYFIYGRKQKNGLALASGIGLMVYTYALSSPVWIVLVGLAMMALPFVIRL
ncbi:MAG: hypothetical protein ABIJ95_11435 [Pseudomonadota bacterium]